jgi:predicted transcriptional regulator
MPMKSGQLTSTGLPARILDVLETDGGWLTTEGVALQVGGRDDSVQRALYRLHDRGLVESRRFRLAQVSGRPSRTYSGNGLGSWFDWRTEWRV